MNAKYDVLHHSRYDITHLQYFYITMFDIVEPGSVLDFAYQIGVSF